MEAFKKIYLLEHILVVSNILTFVRNALQQRSLVEDYH